MTMWFIAGTHFPHLQIIELARQPFRDADQMDEARGMPEPAQSGGDTP